MLTFGQDESESALRKRVQEDSGFNTIVFPITGYSEDFFAKKIEDITKYYESDGYIIEKVVFFMKKDHKYARINMRKNTQTDHLSAPTQ